MLKRKWRWRVGREEERRGGGGGEGGRRWGRDDERGVKCLTNLGSRSHPSVNPVNPCSASVPHNSNHRHRHLHCGKTTACIAPFRNRQTNRMPYLWKTPKSIIEIADPNRAYLPVHPSTRARECARTCALASNGIAQALKTLRDVRCASAYTCLLPAFLSF